LLWIYCELLILQQQEAQQNKALFYNYLYNLFMLTTLHGIILRTIKYSESSVICDIFTKEFGLRTYIVSGVRQQKAKISLGMLRPMNWVEFIAYHREDKEINRVKELKSDIIYNKIPYSLIRGSIALFITELTQKTVKETVENAELYEFLQNTFIFLDSSEEKLNNFHLSFMAKLSIFLGFMPEILESDFTGADIYFDFKEGILLPEKPDHLYFLNPEHTRLLITLLETDMTESGNINLNVHMRQDFIEAFIKIYRYHFDHLHINAHEILHQVLS
jgi:DNA repair protein RecO (recombination protein O)